MTKSPKLLIALYTMLSITFLQHTAFAQKVNFLSELNRLYDVTSLPKYIDNSVVKQFSSYDRTGGNNDGFEGTFSFIRKDKEGSLVVFETEGKGVIERLWTPTPTNDTLDFYLDGSKNPTFSIKFNDLFTGKIYPFIPPLVGQHIVGGYYSYLPIPYNKGCKIVLRAKKMLFYQFQYRAYTGNEQVESFNPMRINADEGKQLNKLVRLWNYQNQDVKSFNANYVSVIPSVFQLKPNTSFTIAKLNKGGRIVGLEFDPATNFEGLHKQIDLKITWDDEKTPAVNVPIADMFGFAFGSRSMRSLLMGVSYAGKAYCYIPMPFDKSAKIELVYRGGVAGEKPVDISAKVFYTDQQRVTNQEGRFYANWKREEPALGEPYVFLKGKGRGHYVGTVLHSQATDFTNFTEFFEGDDKTVIDGQLTIHGTGSEDYFNGGWYAQAGGWVEKLGTQLHGCLDYSLPLGRTGGYRFFISDKMPFKQSIEHNMEHGPVNNNRMVDYTSVAMYYADSPVQETAIPVNALTKVRIENTYTFYSRLMDHLTYKQDLSLKNGSSEFNGTNGTMNIDISEIPTGRYRLYIHTVLDMPDEMQMGIKQIDGTTSWTKIASATGKTDLFIGDAEVIGTKTPIEIYFKSNKNNRLIFERVIFKKL